VINPSDHWYALRELKGKWFDLDSLAPEPSVVDNIEERVHKAKDSNQNVFGVKNIELFSKMSLKKMCKELRENQFLIPFSMLEQGSSVPGFGSASEVSSAVMVADDPMASTPAAYADNPY
jgi:Josephin